MGRQAANTKQKRQKAASSKAVVTKKRANALSKMNSALLAEYNRLDHSLNDVREDNIRYYWRIGETMEKIKSESDKYVGNDGTPGDDLISEAMALAARTLRACAQFRRMYNEEQLEQLLSLHDPDTNHRLHWGHVIYLLTVPQQRSREKYQREAVQKMMDPKELHAYIKKKTGREGQRHGRPLKMPKGVPSQIKHVTRLCEEWIKKNEIIWNGTQESVWGNVMNLDPADMAPEMVEQLTYIKDMMTTITDAARENAEKAERGQKYIKKAIEAREKEAESVKNKVGKRARRISL